MMCFLLIKMSFLKHFVLKIIWSNLHKVKLSGVYSQFKEIYLFNKVTCGCILGMRSTFDYADVNTYIWKPEENFGFFLY